MKNIKIDICIRCGLSKKDVKAEGSSGCYSYGKKVANKHMWTYDKDMADGFKNGKTTISLE